PLVARPAWRVARPRPTCDWPSQRSWPNVKLVVAWRERGPPLLGGPFTFPVRGKRRCRSGLTALTRSACPAGIRSPRHYTSLRSIGLYCAVASPAALARLLMAADG